MNLAMTAYLMTIAAGIPISGWLTDRFGGRRVFMTAIAVFTVASLLCAVSVSFPCWWAVGCCRARAER